MALDPAQLQACILYEDRDLVVVDKPWGLPSSGRQLKDPDCLQYALMQRHVSMVWAVHQLDADTSGVNLFVRRRELVGEWQARIRFPAARKRYLALVRGHPPAQRIDAAIGVVREEPSVCLGVTAAGRGAATQLEVLARGEDASLCELTLETGRTHQIRIHLQHIGHPLLGETWYVPERCGRHRRQALHAWRMEFEVPAPGAPWTAELPEDLRELCRQVGIEAPTSRSGSV